MFDDECISFFTNLAELYTDQWYRAGVWDAGFNEHVYWTQSFTSRCTSWERWLLLETVDQRQTILHKSSPRSWDRGFERNFTRHTSSGATGCYNCDQKIFLWYLFELPLLAFLYITIYITCNKSEYNLDIVHNCTEMTYPCAFRKL